MKYLMIATGLAFVSHAALCAKILPPEIKCKNSEYSGDNWAALCDNGTDELVVKGVGVCNDVEAPAYTQTEMLTAPEDGDDAIGCWCRISSPFRSQYVFLRSYVYANECQNWCASFCARDIVSNKQLRNAIFRGIK